MNWAQAAVLVLACSTSTAAQEGNFSVFDENDSFAPGSLGSDENYTQGVRFEIPTSPCADGILCFFDRHLGMASWLQRRMAGLGLLAGVPYSRSNSIVIGQGIVTPALITSYVEDKSDRPFSGFLYVGSRASVLPETRSDWKWQPGYTLEVVGGLIGPTALARDAQAGLHVVKTHRIPKGWRYQLPNEPQVNASFSALARWGNPTFDVVPSITTALGTVQTHAAAGLTVRLGSNMTGFPVLTSFYAAAPATEEGVSPWEYGLFGGVEARYVARNAHLDGTLFGAEELLIDKVNGVYEWKFGGFLRHRRWRFNYTLVRRSEEFLPRPAGSDGHHWFGSFAVSREFSDKNWKWEGPPRPLLRDWTIEFGLGRGRTWLSPEWLGQSASNGPGGQIGLDRGIRRKWSFSFSRAGVGREEGPPDENGEHRDTFVVSNIFGPTYWLQGRRNRPGSPFVRLGVGWATAKREFTVDGEPIDTRALTDTGIAFTLEGGYMFNLGYDLSVGTSVRWSILRELEVAQLRQAEFLSWGLVARWNLKPDRSSVGSSSDSH
jgi:hypothetical protein